MLKSFIMENGFVLLWNRFIRASGHLLGRSNCNGGENDVRSFLGSQHLLTPSTVFNAMNSFIL